MITEFQVKEYIQHIICLSSTECNSLDLEDLIGTSFQPDQILAARTEALLFILINSHQPIVRNELMLQFS